MSWFKNIFKKKDRGVIDNDLSRLKNDIHSHLIPGIDDGAKNLDDSISLIQGLQGLGYKKLITTPHVMADYYKNDSQIITKGLTRLQEALKLHKIDVEVEASAEYYLDDHFMDLIKKKDLLPIAGKYILFELSFFEEPKMLDQVIFDLQLEGYTAILAHPDRYPYWHKNFDKYEKLIDKGVLFQLNLGSLSGNYGPEVMKTAERMIDNQWISFLGSDTHHMLHIQMFSSLKTNPLLAGLLKQNTLLNSSL